MKPLMLFLTCRFCSNYVSGGWNICADCRYNNIILIGRPKPRVLNKKEMLEMLAKLRSERSVKSPE